MKRTNNEGNDLVNVWSYPHDPTFKNYQENTFNKNFYRRVFADFRYNTNATLEEVKEDALAFIDKNRNEVLFVNGNLFFYINDKLTQVNKKGE